MPLMWRPFDCMSSPCRCCWSRLASEFPQLRSHCSRVQDMFDTKSEKEGRGLEVAAPRIDNNKRGWVKGWGVQI